MRLIPALPLTALALMALPLPGRAHPHIFIETTLHFVITPDHRVTGVEVTWRYDELYSMLLVQDEGLDQDYDGVLTEPELAQLDGYDLNWMPGFEGDLHMWSEGAKVPLGPPLSQGVAFENGQFISRHSRSVGGPDGVPADGMLAKAFDPTFYTGYDLNGGVTLDQGCTATITAPERDATLRALAEAMSSVPADATDYPEVGERFADDILLSCDP